MNKKLFALLSLLVLVSMLLSACGVAAIEEPSEIQTLNASIAVDPCEGVQNCLKVIVSERSDGSKSAFVGGESKDKYEVTFSNKYTVTANTTVDLTNEDYSQVPEVSGCTSVSWSLDGTSESTTVDATYVFTC